MRLSRSRDLAIYAALTALLWTAGAGQAAIITEHTVDASSSAAPVPHVGASPFEYGDGTLDIETLLGNRAPSGFESFPALSTGHSTAFDLFDFTVTPDAGSILNDSAEQSNGQGGSPGGNAGSMLPWAALVNGGTSFGAGAPLGLTPSPALWNRLTVNESSVSALQNGSLGFHLDNVTLIGSLQGGIPHTPEPSSIVLLSIGNGLAGLVAMLRRHRRTAARV